MKGDDSLKPLSDADRGLISRLLEVSEAEGASRVNFLARISADLDVLGFSGDHRNTLFDYARLRAEASNRLASDTIAEPHVIEAKRILADCAAQIDAQAWRTTVREHWPAPIAHEIDRLVEVMRRSGSPDSAILQLRDVVETLVKVTTAILARSLLEADPTTSDRARRLLFRSGLSLGAWAAMLADLANDAVQLQSLHPPLRTLASCAQKLLAPTAGQFAEIRNNIIGHGARALDPRETARWVEGFILTGRFKDVRGQARALTPLSTLLAEMIGLRAFEGLALEIERDGQILSLRGSVAMESWLRDRSNDAGHGPGVMVPVRVRFDGGETLALAPFIAARVCAQCSRRDVFLFDSVYDHRRGGRFDLLDYARGHKTRLPGALAPDLADALPVEPAPSLEGESLNLQRVLEALDKARIDRAYLSPAYLRDDLRRFLNANRGGVFWLQAPAHTGKTTFVQGLAEPEIDEDPIDPRFRGPLGGRVIAYYCRKEHRTGLAGLINTLDRKLHEAFQPSDMIRSEAPAPKPVVDQGTPVAFVTWLNAWRLFADRHRLAAPDAPLIVIIDGLDEAESPDQSSALSVLPRCEDVPDGIYLILTSRPVGDAEAPQFLRTFVEPIYTASAAS